MLSAKRGWPCGPEKGSLTHTHTSLERNGCKALVASRGHFPFLNTESNVGVSVAAFVGLIRPAGGQQAQRPSPPGGCPPRLSFGGFGPFPPGWPRSRLAPRGSFFFFTPRGKPGRPERDPATARLPRPGPRERAEGCSGAAEACLFFFLFFFLLCRFIFGNCESAPGLSRQADGTESRWLQKKGFPGPCAVI